MLRRPGIDPNTLLRQAETHYGADRPGSARPLLEQLLRMIPGHPAILHLYALVLFDLGEFEKARPVFRKARAAAPGDPQIANNFGNLLSKIGNHNDALAEYDAAIALDPAFAQARLHRAMMLEELGRFGEARAEFAALGRYAAPSSEILLAMASLERAAGQPAAAAAHLDAAIAIDPANAKARIGRARLALDLGEADVVGRYRRELHADPANRDAIIGYVDAAAGAASRKDALDRLADAVAADPSWREGQKSLAQARWEGGDAAGYRTAYEDALARRPRDRDLWSDYIAVVASTDAHLDAAALCRRASAATGLNMFLAGAFGFHSAAGELTAADALLAKLPRGTIAPLALAKHRLRYRDAAAAEALLAQHVASAPNDIEAWALRSIAWQLLGDDRFHWLNDQPGLIGVCDLPIDPAGIADHLRGLHADSAERLGQSVRGGTQTLGNLFDRAEKESIALRDAIAMTVERHRTAMPPADPTHPILRHRDHPLDFAGAWSIRLVGGGRHVQHIHPRGILSAASYWALPPGEGDDPQAGWLEIGGAPDYLGFDLVPFRTIEPALGRLVLFPSTLHHGTRRFAAGERISVAFDVIPARG